MSITGLQNGSDIRGRAIAYGNEPVTLGVNEAEKIGRSFAIWASGKTVTEPEKLTIAIGNDPRVTSGILKEALCRGICSTGASVTDTKLSSTPAMFMAVKLNPDINASVMITASHLPPDRNGFKFFTGEGGAGSGDIKKILEMCLPEDESVSNKSVSVNQPAGSAGGKTTVRDLNSAYFDHLVNSVTQRTGKDKPLKGFHIIVDAGNGSGGFFATKILERLGAVTTGSLYLEPDGMFPNHIPNPEDSTAITELCEAVVREKADMGIIFDTDVDRAAIVDSAGNPVARNELIALISAIMLEEYPGSWVVTDSITSSHLTTFIEEELGGHHHRFKRGYKNVINEAVRLNSERKKCHLAIETSGHAALKENFFLDDGAYLVTRILASASVMGPGKNITSLITGLRQPAEAKEFRINILSSDFAETGKRIIDTLGRHADTTDGWTRAKQNYEGVRIVCEADQGNGWFLLRMSLHDPVLPLNLESDQPGGIAVMVSGLIKLLKDDKDLDISALRN
ncbi:MAG: phosphomannomutase/phosphoglucomutase [Bacteroidales bacterium]|nr:phosphomannomutase/phosphoglucomutase [Bacteroidales bacterium]